MPKTFGGARRSFGIKLNSILAGQRDSGRQASAAKRPPLCVWLVSSLIGAQIRARPPPLIEPRPERQVKTATETRSRQRARSARCLVLISLATRRGRPRCDSTRLGAHPPAGSSNLMTQIIELLLLGADLAPVGFVPIRGARRWPKWPFVRLIAGRPARLGVHLNLRPLPAGLAIRSGTRLWNLGKSVFRAGARRAEILGAPI